MKTTVTTVLDEICKVSDYPYFVSMTDKFLSGWGMAKGKTAKRVYLCKTLDIAQNLVQRLEDRKNTTYMRDIKIHSSLPYYSAKYTVSYDDQPESAYNY